MEWGRELLVAARAMYVDTCTGVLSVCPSELCAVGRQDVP
jgi:hypothetical protein